MKRCWPKALTGNSGWDVVFPSNYLIRAMRENELLAPLRHDWLKNLGNLETRFRAPSWDAELRWSVPYMWGASGIVFDRKVTPAPAAWSDLWRPALRNRITMLDDGSEVLGACLKKLGYSVNSCQPDELAQARREAVAQKQLLRAYLNAEARDQLVSGRHPGGATLGHHVAAGHGRGACAPIRLPGGRLRAVRG